MYFAPPVSLSFLGTDRPTTDDCITANITCPSFLHTSATNTRFSQ